MKKLFKRLTQSERDIDAGGTTARTGLMGRLVIHPFLLAIYPLLFLYYKNYESVPVGYVLNSMLRMIFLAGVLFVVLNRVMKSKAKAGLLASVSFMLFFNYGAIREYLAANSYQIGQNHYLMLTNAGLFLIGAGVIARMARSAEILTKFLNLFSIVLVLMASAMLLLAVQEYSVASANSFELSGSDLEEMRRESDGNGTQPDIYYIILDGYASSATLRDSYDYPDNDLVGFLQEKGFYVASDSVANYSYTFLSLASSLNMSHLLNLGEKIGTSSTFKKPVFEMAEDHAVARYLKSRGYTYIHYGSRYELTRKNRQADININCNPEEFNYWLSLLARTTMLSGLEPLTPNGWLPYVKMESKKTLCPFRETGVALNAPGPKFVFMHVLLPHPPFFFRRNGEMWNESIVLSIEAPWVKDKYLEQLIFLNGKVKELIENILASSPKPPIIVLQADHGPALNMKWESPTDLALKERMTILNAYLLPDGGDKALYSTITPVNSFRVIFNHYFNAKFQPLEDRSYFSTWDKPYAFEDVTDRVLSRQSAPDRKAEGF